MAVSRGGNVFLGAALFAWAQDQNRGYRAMFQHLRRFAPQPQDLRMVIGPRFGPVMVLEGDVELGLERE